MTLEVGQIYEGKVTGITKFGAFVSFEGGQTGMVHISEVAPTFVNEIKDFVTDPKGAIENLTGHSVSDDDLSKIVDGVKNTVGGGLGNLGDMLEKTPLGGIADSLGGLFGKK